MEERLSIPMHVEETEYAYVTHSLLYVWRRDWVYLCMEERMSIPMHWGETGIGILSPSSMHRYTQSILPILLCPLVYFMQRLLHYLEFKSCDFECSWWRLFKNASCARTLDINSLIMNSFDWSDWVHNMDGNNTLRPKKVINCVMAVLMLSMYGK
jgi:hypothetical protein